MVMGREETMTRLFKQGLINSIISGFTRIRPMDWLVVVTGRSTVGQAGSARQPPYRLLKAKNGYDTLERHLLVPKWYMRRSAKIKAWRVFL
jgi:hypothetical protein